MKWIFVGLLLGSTVTSEHDTREACEGRAVTLREKGVAGKCHETGSQFTTIYSGNAIQCIQSNGSSGPCR